MPTGVVIKDKNGNTQQVPFDKLQEVDPFLYSQYVKNVAQPNAQLQQTQTATGAEGASAARTMAEIPGVQANTKVEQNNADKVTALNLIQKLFDANKGKDSRVSPDMYNSAKSSVSNLIDSDAFDSKFEKSYTNPDNHYYDTPSDRGVRQTFDQTKRQIQASIDAYNSIPEDQKGLFSKSSVANVPGLGGVLGQVIAPQATEYEKQRTGLSAQLEQIVGAGSGSGIKVSQTELNNWTNLLPSPKKTTEQNNYDLKQLDTQLKARFNLGSGLDEGYLPKGNKPPTKPKGSSNTIKVGNYDVEVQ